MMKILPVAALISAVLFASAPAEASRICRSHGRFVHCHRVLAPRLNFHKHSKVKVLRCRGPHGHFINC